MHYWAGWWKDCRRRVSAVEPVMWSREMGVRGNPRWLGLQKRTVEDESFIPLDNLYSQIYRLVGVLEPGISKG